MSMKFMFGTLSRDSETEVEQVGVKGMKWGVRRDETGKASTVKSKDAQMGIVPGFNASQGVHKEAEKVMRKGLENLNNESTFKDRNLLAKGNEILLNQYNQRLVDLGSSAYQTAVYNTYKKQAKRARVLHTTVSAARLVVGVGLVAFGVARLLHADTEHEEKMSFELELTRDENGFVVDLKPAEESIKHFGVKGQRWGFRKATTRGGTPPSKRKAKPDEGEKKEVPKKKSVKDLSDSELREAINRIQLEKQYSQMTTPQKAESVVSSVLKQSGKAIAGQVLTQVGTAYLSKAIGVNLNKALPDAYRVTGKKG